MRVGTYHTFQCPPWMDPHDVFHGEIERAVLAEELGYDSVWVPEQHFFDYCLCGDALQMASFIAAQTNRVRIGTAIVNLTFTHPLRFAERVAMLDILSGGRVDIGVGRGYQWPQYPVMQVDMETTRERFDESLDIVLSAWKPHEFEHRGAVLRHSPGTPLAGSRSGNPRTFCSTLPPARPASTTPSRAGYRPSSRASSRSRDEAEAFADVSLQGRGGRRRHRQDPAAGDRDALHLRGRNPQGGPDARSRAIRMAFRPRHRADHSARRGASSFVRHARSGRRSPRPCPT